MKIIIGLVLKGTRTKLVILFYILLAVGAGFLLLYANDQLALVLNEYLMVQNFDGFAQRMLLTAGMFTLIFGMNTFGAYLHEDFSWGVITRFPQYYIANLLRAKQSYFTSRPVAQLHTDLWTASQAAGGFFGNLQRMISRVVIFVFYGIVVFSFDMWAGIFSVVALPLYFLFTMGAGNRIADLQHDYVSQNGELATVTQESFDNVGNIKAKGAYSFSLGRSVAVLRKIKKICVNVGVISHYTTNITGLIRIIAPILIIFGAMQISSGFDATAGNIMVLFINIPLFLGGLADVHNSFIYYKMSRPFLDKLMEFNDAEIENESGLDIAAFESLQTEGVKVEFPGGRVVAVPDFKMNQGEKIMLFGDSGIGKSTLLNIIMGFQEYEGAVFINGINLREISLASLRRVFGITFQHTNAMSLDLRENILLGAEKSDSELKRLIQLTALESQQISKGESILSNKALSGGEKSRLGLSQMLAVEPQIMLIDEAFSNMDEELESRIIANLFREYPNRAVICISHRNSSKQFFDSVVEFN